MTNFFTTIGNAFKTGWKNGNIAKGMQIAGSTAMAVGATGAMIHAMKHSGGCCHGGGSVFGGLFGNNGCGMNDWGTGVNSGRYQFNSFGVSPYLMNNPMAILNYSGGTGNMFPNMYGSGTNYAALDQFASAMFNNQLMQQAQNNRLFSSTSGSSVAAKTSNKFAELDESQDKTKGEDFQKKFNMATKDTSADIQMFEMTKDDTTKTYKEKMTDLAKSYTASLESDGKEGISIDEFNDKFVGAKTVGEFDQLKAAFNKVDQNGDGKLDWKEMASLLSAFDRIGNKNKEADGTISNEEFKAGIQSLSDLDDKDKFGKTLQDNYKALFEDE